VTWLTAVGTHAGYHAAQIDPASADVDINMHDDTLKLIKPVKENDSGHVVVDSRGRNVWQWKDAEVDSTSLVLKRLENDALELEPTRKVPVQKPPTEHAERVASRPEQASRRRPTKAGRDPARYPERPARVRLSVGEPSGSDVGGGFDPYNRS
jgi:hypothetical protein